MDFLGKLKGDLEAINEIFNNGGTPVVSPTTGEVVDASEDD